MRRTEQMLHVERAWPHLFLRRREERSERLRAHSSKLRQDAIVCKIPHSQRGLKGDPALADSLQATGDTALRTIPIALCTSAIVPDFSWIATGRTIETRRPGAVVTKQSGETSCWAI
jgi:hypothetical protein